MKMSDLVENGVVVSQQPSQAASMNGPQQQQPKPASSPIQTKSAITGEINNGNLETQQIIGGMSKGDSVDGYQVIDSNSSFHKQQHQQGYLRGGNNSSRQSQSQHQQNNNNNMSRQQHYSHQQYHNNKHNINNNNHINNLKGDNESNINHVLLITVINPHYPIACELIHQICSNYGKVNRIVIFKKNGIQAMVEFDSVESAKRAKSLLHGCDIYSGCCTLRIEYAKPTKLNVHRNDSESFDYTNPTLGSNGANDDPDPQQQHHHHHHNHAVTQHPHSHHQHHQVSGHQHAGYPNNSTIHHHQQPHTKGGSNMSMTNRRDLGIGGGASGTDGGTQLHDHPQHQQHHHHHHQHHNPHSHQPNQFQSQKQLQQPSTVPPISTTGQQDHSATAVAAAVHQYGLGQQISAEPGFQQAQASAQQQQEGFGVSRASATSAGVAAATATSSGTGAGYLGADPFAMGTASAHAMHPSGASGGNLFTRHDNQHLPNSHHHHNPHHHHHPHSHHHQQQQQTHRMGGGGGGGAGASSGMNPHHHHHQHHQHPNHHSAFATQNAALMAGPAGMFPQGTVMMVYGLNLERVNCDRLFNLFCLYGNVVRVKFLRTKDGCAMVQMGDVLAVDRCVSSLNKITIFGNELQISYSKQAFLHDVLRPFLLPDGSPSFKDFMGSKNNRFRNPEVASKNRILPPSQVLHFFNAPFGITEEELIQVFKQNSGHETVSLKIFTPKTENTKSHSGLVTFRDPIEATEALVLCNHLSMPRVGAPHPYILRLCFSPPIYARQNQNQQQQQQQTDMSQEATLSSFATGSSTQLSNPSATSASAGAPEASAAAASAAAVAAVTAPPPPPPPPAPTSSAPPC